MLSYFKLVKAEFSNFNLIYSNCKRKRIMPHIKNALIRYRIIDKCLRNEYKTYPTKEALRLACEEALFGDADGAHICNSTIEKDMYAMKMEHDAPIKYSKANLGYYYTDKEFSLNDIPLSADDIQSIQFAASTLAQFKDTSIFKQFGFALNKIIDRVNVTNAASEEDISKFVQFETGVVHPGSEYLSPLLEAITKNKVVYFEYASFISGKRKRRKVAPLLLKEYRNRWYVITHDLVKDAIITYALDRISDLERADADFPRPNSFDPDLFFKHAIGITTNDQQPETIQFKADNVAAKYIQSQPFHHSQKVVKEGRNKTTFELFVIVSEELIRSLLSYGPEIKVTEPESLVTTLKERIEGMVGNY